MSVHRIYYGFHFLHIKILTFCFDNVNVALRKAGGTIGKM